MKLLSKVICFSILIFFLQDRLLPNAFGQDSLEVQFSIVGMSFHGDYNELKIKVPPWLKSSELIPQIKRAVIWPGEPLPGKKTIVYVFKETDQIGEVSKTGAVYLPGIGFRWSLSEWQPGIIPDKIPAARDIDIYNTFIDRILVEGSSLDNYDIKRKVATEYNISLGELDSIYCWVKFWMTSTKANR